MSEYHTPALLTQTLQLLDIKPGGVYVDVTLGGGGHTRAILEAGGRVVAFDQDIDAIRNIESVDPVADPTRLTTVNGNFRYLTNYLRYLGIDSVDGILADLGVSSHHFDAPERGFSFRWEGPLDMRMNRTASRTAADVVNSLSEADLASLLRLYGEVDNAGRVAAAIVKARPMSESGELLAAVEPLLNPRKAKQDLAKIYQALRIEVNDEMGALAALLNQSLQALKPGGRLAVITYHSLEDRLVKNFMRDGNLEGSRQTDIYGRSETPWRLVTRKPVTADAAETQSNPRARSAKLRVAEKIG